jgi:tripartite-type tricarboxylate transporter receptor subunit TctC
VKLPRRKFLHLAAGAAALPAMTRIASALDYPSRPVRIIVGFPPGGADIVARLIGQYLSERFAQAFVVENRPGAGGNVGAEVVVRAAPDGYTLLLASPANAFSASLYDHLNFNFVRDIAPIASIMRIPLVMEVNPSFPARTVSEFIAYAKANSGKINMATAGIGSTDHIYGELFKMMAGIDLVPVHYRGAGPALVDLMSGQVQVMFDPIVSSIEHIKAGKLRALAVTSATRSDALPDVPAAGDFVPGYEATAWAGIGAPKNTPPEIIDKLNEAVNASLVDPKFKAHLADLGGQEFTSSPAAFGKFLADETEKVGKVIRAANIKAE